MCTVDIEDSTTSYFIVFTKNVSEAQSETRSQVIKLKFSFLLKYTLGYNILSDKKNQKCFSNSFCIVA